MIIESFKYRALKLLGQKPYKLIVNVIVPRRIRRRWRKNLDVREQAQVARKWDEYLANWRAAPPSNTLVKKKQDFKDQKIIWQYWAQGQDDLPLVVQLCNSSIDRYAQDYSIIRLSDQNIGDYLEFPDFVEMKRKSKSVKIAHFSDLLRISLLYLYGGVWLDSTVFLTAPLPRTFSQEDVFMFSRDVSSKHKHLWDASHPYFDWESGARVRHLNSIIFAHQFSQQLKPLLDLLLMYWSGERGFEHYFFFQILCEKMRSTGEALAEMRVEDDALPHLLERVLNKKFDKDDYFEIKSQTCIHKLGWRKNYKKVDALGRLTYYGYISNKNIIH